MNLDNLIAELNNNFSVDAKVLEKLVDNEGYVGAVNVKWDSVGNVYNVSNHYNQVCAYKQLCLDRTSEIKVGSAVKGHAVAEILNFLSKFKPEVKVQTKTVSKPKPILKVKANQESEWKARALKAEADQDKERSNHRRELEILRNEIEDLRSENQILKTVAKQAVVNNVKIMNSIGIQVTQEDLGL